MNEDKIQIIKDDEIDLRALFQVLWNDRKRIIQITAVITLMGVLYALLATPLYKSTITMYPSDQKGGGQLNQLQGMASTFGFDMGDGETSFNIPDVVNSRHLKTELIYHEWNSEEFEIPVNLIHYWGIDDTTSTGISLNPMNWMKALLSSDAVGYVDRKFKWEVGALNILDGRISVKEDKTGLISIDVLMEEPNMAAELANAMYQVIVDFNVEIHTRKARLNREFIQGRQMDVKEQLTEAEDVLKVFRERNRSIIESPQLQLEVECLIRKVTIKTQVYITLQQQYEMARIEEVKATPSVIILDEAQLAINKEQPKRKLMVITAMFLGSMVALGVTILKREIYYFYTLQ